LQRLRQLQSLVALFEEVSNGSAATLIRAGQLVAQPLQRLDLAGQSG
jgi:hypothetical protein